MKRSYYSWIVCALATMLLITNLAFSGNLLMVYFPFVEEKGLSGTQISSLVSIRCGLAIAAMYLLPFYYRRLSLRKGLTLAAVLTTLGFFLFSVAGSCYAVYAMAAVACAIGFGLGAMVPLSVLIRNWFYQGSSTALSVCSAGTGLSTVILTPIVTNIYIEHGLWAAFFIPTVLSLLTAVASYIVLRDTPAELGLLPFGASEDTPIEEIKMETKGSAVRWSLPTVLLVASSLLNGGFTMAALGHYSLLFRTQGYSLESVSFAISMMGFALIGGKLIYGYLVDQIGAFWPSFVSFGLLLVGCILCALGDGVHTFIMVSGLLLMGIGFPVSTVGISFWAGDFVPSNSYSTLIKWMQMASALGGAVFSAIPGILYDATSSYRISYILCAVMILVTGVCVCAAYGCRRTAKQR